jgi:hypothetical protein
MSPTVFRKRGYRFYFFSREEARMHVHVHSPRGEAKFWMEPDIELVRTHGFLWSELTSIEKLIREHQDEIRKAWKAHFGR